MTRQDAAKLLEKYMQFRKGSVWVLPDYALVNEALQIAIDALDEEPDKVRVVLPHIVEHGFWDK